MAMNLEIGVIETKESPPARVPSTVVAAEAFAAAITQRYVEQPLTVPFVDLSFARQPRPESNHFHSALRINISPTINIRQQYMFKQFSKEISAPRETIGFSQIEASAPTEASTPIERLFAQHTRVAAFGSPMVLEKRVAFPEPAQGFARSLGNFPQAQIVEKVLARPMVPENLPAQTERWLPVQAAERSMDFGASPLVHATTREMEWGSKSLFKAESKPLVLPAPEVRRVADQVMREIDHRITARRERLGKR